MPLKFVEWYTREQIQGHSDILFVFGDNFARKGFGGQAKECRGEPNAIGIATKRVPTWNGYLRDDDFDAWNDANSDAFLQIEEALKAGEIVVFPSAGLGTGLAQLEQRAPKIWAELQKWIEQWEARYGRV
jgi:hypothetical protein